MTITVTDNYTDCGYERISFRYGALKTGGGFGCLFEYHSSRSAEKHVTYRSDVIRHKDEYCAVLAAVKQAATYVAREKGDASLVSRVWTRYLDTKQQRLFEEAV